MSGSSATPDPSETPPPSDESFPGESLPSDLAFPANLSLPPDLAFPANISLPPDLAFPAGMPLAEGFPTGMEVSQGMPAPAADLPLLQSDDFLPPVSRWMRRGGYLMAGTLCGAIALAALVPYDVTVQAEASVRPAGELNVLQAGVDGTVSAVKVQPNQTVKQGDVLVEIVQDRNRLRVLQANQNTLERAIRQYKAKLSGVNSQLQALDREILARAKVTPVPSPVTPIEPGAESNTETLATSTLEAMGRAGAKYSARRDLLLQQRTALQNQIQYSGQDLEAVNAEVNKQIVRSPVDGKLLKLDINNPGQTVRVGDAIAQIVPQNVPLVVKGQVETQDIGKVAVGQSAHLRISAYPYPDYGVLQGKVEAIAPDVTTVRDANSSGMAYYEVTIKPDQPYLTKDNRQYPIQAGMDARADIVSRQETLLQFLLRKARLWTDL